MELESKVIDRISDFKILNCPLRFSSVSDVWKNSINIKLSDDPTAGDFNVSCLLDCKNDAANKRKIHIVIKKTCFKPALATIRVQLSEMNPHVRNVNDWKQDCVFKDLHFKHEAQTCLSYGHCSKSKTHSHDYLIELKCQIIWYGFIDEFYSPNSGRIFTRYSDNMDYCDMKIKVGKKYYAAHKLIVTSQSSVLKKTLDGNFKESLKNCVDLTVFGAEVVEELLLFLYENRIDEAYNDEDLLLKLLKVGDMYDIPDLKKCCGMLLSNMLTEENVLMLLENGHAHRSSILQTRAIAYVIERKDKFLTLQDFKEMILRQPGLFCEICLMINFFFSS